ncbi:protein CREG1 isoform X2 [Pristis pectinata]|uniref:protein CREG1 isoform X2 n=1 Tax=Pristis pectinata TaxID=685728 RepID=UPI00223E1CF1|nr:protein CREG1 isoform X2 [Pristis pectinata]
MALGALGPFLLPLAFLSCVGAIPPHDEVARMARYVVNSCDWASMATISTHKPVVGRAFSNVFSISDGPPQRGSGVPYLYLTPLEISVQDIKINPEVSLAMTLAQTDYCRKNGFDAQSPLCCRVILCGTIVTVNKTEIGIAKKALFERHPAMASWPPDHGWYFAKLNITNIWVLDYFGGLKTVTPEEYYNAKPEYERNLTGGWKL